MFTEIPTNLSSLFSELIYTYYSSYKRDMTLQIYEDETDELLGVKKFYSTSTAQLNIAPHIRSFSMPMIEAQPVGFISTYRNGNLSVYITMDQSNISSAVRQFTLSRSDLETSGLISSMPAVRTISDGESEQLLFAGEAGESVNVVVKHYLTGWNNAHERPYVEGNFEEDLVSSKSYTTNLSDGNLATFNYVANSKMSGGGSQIEKVVVTATQNSVELGQVTYHIVEAPAGAVRLAWLSECGSIEHYTFPVVKSKHVGGKYKRTFTLTSAFEGYAARAALAEIIRSPKIWIDEEGVYHEAMAESGELAVSSTTSLGTIDIKISYRD